MIPPGLIQMLLLLELLLLLYVFYDVLVQGREALPYNYVINTCSRSSTRSSSSSSSSSSSIIWIRPGGIIILFFQVPLWAGTPLGRPRYEESDKANSESTKSETETALADDTATLQVANKHGSINQTQIVCSTNTSFWFNKRRFLV